MPARLCRDDEVNRRTQTLKGFNAVNNPVLPAKLCRDDEVNRRTQTLKGFNAVNNPVLPARLCGDDEVNRRTQTLKGFNAVNNHILPAGLYGGQGEVKMTQKKELNKMQTVFTEESTMEELMSEMRETPEIKPGAKLTVAIIAKSKEGFVVDLGTKVDGLIPFSEYEGSVIPENIKVGAQIKVKVMDMRGGQIKLSHKEVASEEAFDNLDKAFKEKKHINGTIVKAVKGGFIVDVGAQAFLPMSQADISQVKDPEKYVGKIYQFLVLEFDKYKRQIVVSRRKILEAQRDEKKKFLLANLVEGQIIDGAVSDIVKFGAFIDLGGIDGLLHIGEIAWHSVNKVEDLLRKGQTVRVKIINIDREKGKISLSVKSLLPNPWESISEKFPIGMITKGKIVSIIDSGAFIEIEEGIDGFLHNSEYAWNDSVAEMKKNVKKGKEIDVKITAVDVENKKISLSVKQITANPWEEAYKHYSPGMAVKGKVENFMPFGAFIKLPEGVEGLVHISDFSWTKKINRPQDMLKKGDEIAVVVLEVNPQKEKISLSIKHNTTDPYKKYKNGTMVKGKITRALDFGVFMEIEEGVEALIKNSEATAEKVERGVQVLKVGDEAQAQIIKCDIKERKLEASVRKLERAQERELVKKYSNQSVKQTLGDILVSEEESESIQE
ncbi:MAG: 30S ribosomal protein S1 [Elusimicrobiota bacterium]|nr:30S ribosomal protein S1 [Elusimicrobiota bacterium]